jgi:hypothetical protein
MLEATHTNLQKHVTDVNAILQVICETPNPAPLVNLSDGIIALAKSCPPGVCREVITEFGIREIALRLPIPNPDSPRFWIAIREQWGPSGKKHRLSFIQCGLKLYVGERTEEAIQCVRLEWVAPTLDDNGVESYQGKHAGHPHWHIDQSALIGQEDYLRSLEILTAPTSTTLEVFTGDTPAALSRPLLDFSWLQSIHFPARAQWMQTKWDGQHVPGPHQCEPNDLEELTHWWEGALRYFSGELPR